MTWRCVIRSLIDTDSFETNLLANADVLLMNEQERSNLEIRTIFHLKIYGDQRLGDYVDGFSFQMDVRYDV